MIYFISGHRDLTWEEFTLWYAPTISSIYYCDVDAHFILADCEGCDRMAQNYLSALGIPYSRIMIYHMHEEPSYLADGDWDTMPGYDNDIDRDTAMTRDSDKDIAFIREGKENSGTAQNILRRWTKNL